METYLIGSIVSILMTMVEYSKKRPKNVSYAFGEIVASFILSWLSAILTIRVIHKLNKRG